MPGQADSAGQDRTWTSIAVRSVGRGGLALVNEFQAGAGGRDRTGRDADTDHSAHGGAGGGHSRGRTRTPQAAVAAARRVARILATPFNTPRAPLSTHAELSRWE